MQVPTGPMQWPLGVAGAAIRTLRRRPVGLRADCAHWVMISWAVPPESLEPVLEAPLVPDLVADGDGREWGIVSALVTRLTRIRMSTVALPISPAEDRLEWLASCVLPAAEGGPDRDLLGVRMLAATTDNPLAGLTPRYQVRPRRGRVMIEPDEESGLLITAGDRHSVLEATLQLEASDLPPDTVFVDASSARRPVASSRRGLRVEAEGPLELPVERIRFLPRPVGVEVERADWWDHGPLAGVEHRLCGASYAQVSELRLRPGRWVHPPEPD